MIQVIIPALSVSQHFNSYVLGENDELKNTEFILPVDDFKYPAHYGSSYFDNDTYDQFLLVDNSYIIYRNVKYYLKDYELTFFGGSAGLFEPYEVLTFEFETEEEALYFQMKYGG